jgi:septum formation protein
LNRATLLLASSSPRRRELLEALGLDFAVTPVDVDETRLTGESPRAMVLRLAAAKAAAVEAAEDRIVIGADTAVVLEDEVFGKPADRADALSMLARLSGRTHRVFTGVCVRRGGQAWTGASDTEVRMRVIAAGDAERYWQTGEPDGKAGAYAIQGRGGVFVESIAGSYSGVVGLPVFETAELLAAAGYEVLVQGR